MNKLLLAAFAGLVAAGPAVAAPTPVILDTDIGDDIDDTWALGLILKSPQFDLKLVCTTFGKAEYRAKVAARLLTVAGRTDVPVGLGAGGRTGTGNQQPWVQEYDLKSYAGKVYEDGVQALIDTVNAQAQKGRPVTIISIGPLNTLGEALERDPSIAGKASLSAMQGSVRKGYNGADKPSPEWNVKANVPAAQKVFAAPWKQMSITPLDTCGLVNLSGERFAKLKECYDPLTMAVLDSYRIWAKKMALSELQATSTLYDPTAVYLADPGTRPFLTLETLNIAVTPEGMTTIDPAGARMTVATEWKDLDGWRDQLVKTLMGKTVGRR